VVPDAYVGLWRRTLLRTRGVEDITTRVYWLQTASWHADIRIPADRPPLTGRSALPSLTLAEMQALARQHGFAGITEVDGELCRWHRRFDYQPPSGFNDVGRMRFDGADRLLEYGVEQDYFEIWERVPGAGAARAVEFGDAEGRHGLRLQLGPWFMFVRARPTNLTRASGLPELLTAADPVQRTTLLDFEISFGARDGASGPWRIELSTLPWLEGTDLRERVPAP
jgi:hypothetical protein